MIPLRILGEHGIGDPYDRAKAAAASRSGRNVVIPRDDGGFKALPWLRSVEYVPAEDGDLQLPSTSAVRLYEVLWHVSMAGRRLAIDIDITALEFALGLSERNSRDTGWRNERYQDWRDFRKQFTVALSAFREVGWLLVTATGLVRLPSDGGARLRSCNTCGWLVP